MIEFHICLVNTPKGTKFGYTPMSATGYLMPKRVGLFSSDNLTYTVEDDRILGYDINVFRSVLLKKKAGA